MQPATKYHSLPISEALSALSAHNHGLTEAEATKRLEQYGRNVLPDPSSRSPIAMFLSQFKSMLVYILIVAAAISYIYAHYLDVYVIVGVIAINAVVGFIQEFRAEKSIQALKRLIIQEAKVIRDGAIKIISVHELVPGDIMLLDEGNRIPADGRLISVKDVQTDESTLTGESLSVTKDIKTLSAATPMAEQINMLWTGTSLTRGKAQAVVTATGASTVLGQIAKDLQSIEGKADHFMQKTDTLSKQMTLIAIITTVITFLVGYFIRGFAFEDILVFTVASLVSGIPEGLPVVLTVVLGMSAYRMAKKHAIVRRLSATETLSVVDTIITDKTGTLTKNKMTATSIQFPYQPMITAKHSDSTVELVQDNNTPTPEHHPLQTLLHIASACHGVRREVLPDETVEFIGDPTEIAYVALADRAIHSSSYIPQTFHQVADLTFSQEHRWRASLLRGEDEKSLIAVIGAPETVIAQCSHILLPDHHIHNFNHQHRLDIDAQLKHLANQGIRILTFAYKHAESNQNDLAHEGITGLTYLGLVGIVDPPREEVPQAIETARKAGVVTYMATGDHPDTARAIAKQIGLMDEADNSQVVTGIELEVMSDDEIREYAAHHRVFARMTPKAKLRLATILQNDGKIVAMTGDGVNDAPALKQAHIGIAMGKNGTDVARESADIILSDDNFATIVVAIEEGRTQFRNIRRTSFFYVITNFAVSVALIVFLTAGLPIPLLPKQILWLNLISSGVNDIALATEPIHDDVLDGPPRKAQENILNKAVLPLLVSFTVFIVILSLIVYLVLSAESEIKGRTGIFAVLAICQLFNLINMRSIKKSVFSIGIFTNRNVTLALIISVILLLMVIYIPPLQLLFEFAPLSALELISISLASSLIFWISEVVKKIQYRRVIR
jgi:P-type Ca2+ transporter type 2C